MNHPTLILIRGLPGSGKSYITKALAASFKEHEVVMLDPDATDYESREYITHTEALTVDGVDPKLHAYRFLRAQAHEGIANHNIIIWNQPFTNLEIFNKMVANLQAHAQEYATELPILVVEVEIDPDTAKKRVADRKREGGHGPSDNTYARFVNDYTSFAPDGYNTVTVHGQDNVNQSVAAILKALDKLGQ